MKNVNFMFNKEKMGYTLEQHASIYISKREERERREKTTEIDACDMIDVLS